MRPTPRLAWILAFGIAVAFLPALLGPAWSAAWIAFLGAVLGAAALDAVLGVGKRGLAVEVATPGTVYAGDRGAMRVTIAPRAPGRARFRALFDLDPELEAVPEASVDLDGSGPARLEVPLVARRRGRPRVVALWLRWAGPLGLVERRLRVGLDRAVPVVPDVRPVRAAALRFYTGRDAQGGIRPERDLGGGSEFESLREHVHGMDSRAIDWNATARHRRLVCRQYRAERDHRVVVAVDTGRLMREPLAGTPKLDHAIHAGLLLAYVALRAGDRVGLYAFDEKARAWVEPDAGTASFARIQAAAAGLAYATSETNFTLALADLSTRLRRRSLVVVLTDFVDAVTAELMVSNLAHLRRRHVVVFVALRDPGLEEEATREPRSTMDLHRSVVANDLLRDREAVIRRLQRHAIPTVDARPADVGAGILDRYLEIRRRELVG